MAYYAVYDKLSGEIENIVECPEFWSDTIHLYGNQSYLQVESQVSPQEYLIFKDSLVLKG